MLDVALIASATVGVLAPILRHLLKAGAEKAVESASEGVAGTIWEKLKGKIFGKPTVEGAAQEVAATPDSKRAQARFESHIEEILEEDPNLAAEIEKLLRQGGHLHQEANLQGDGAIAQAGPGGRAVAAGKGGIAIGGDSHGDIRIGRGED